MDQYNKIIESLNTKFIAVENVKMLKSFTITNFCDVQNSVFLLHDGEVIITIDKEMINVKKGDVLFIPAGKQCRIGYGLEDEACIEINNEEFVTDRHLYFEPNQNHDKIGKIKNSFSYVTFATKVFDSVNFFTSLDIPPFILYKYKKLGRLIKDVASESLQSYTGKDKVISNKTEEIVIHILRYILQENIFVEKLATNSTYFKDPRLIDVLNYIKEYLSGDLSNKVLASVANVSEDYVGQYFKMLMGINPQDYIEYQRMEKAVDLLRTTQKSIKEIGQEVGYKDTAYFCRRFKMMFGVSAGKMRRRETLLNV